MTGLGNLLLWGALAAALLALGADCARCRGSRWAARTGHKTFTLSALAVLAASLLLLLGFLGNRFEIAYVAQFSSRELPLLYRVSAFWAGQEGSFLLWALFSAFLGLALRRRAGDPEAPVLAVYSAVQVFLLLLLAAKSPFLPAPMPMEDGGGLNPLLQDPWMAIHPPLIFLAYAALAIPFAFALAALFRRDYDAWIARALPWTLFAWSALGAGIFIGGYWAYRVLGWGGYWGWDPVENASLIPWLLCTALLHGMLLQRARSSFRRGNLLLASGTFLMVLYGAFLTRSGVLKDFSVHSFAESGTFLYWTMLAGVLLALLLPLALLLRRAGEIRSEPTYDALISRDFGFFLGILVLCLSAAVVAVGTSAPLITGLFGHPSAVQPQFYNRTHYPIAVLIATLAGVAPILSWRANEVGTALRRLLPYLTAALLTAAIAFFAGVHSGWMLLLLAASGFAFAANLRLLARGFHGAPLRIGAYLSHIGVVLGLIGIVGSGVYSRAQTLTLRPGQTKEALGYRVTYDGAEQSGQEHRVLQLTATRGGETFQAAPAMVFSPQMNSWVHTPALKKYLLHDLYLSPVDLREDAAVGETQLTLDKGQTASVGKYQITFRGFTMQGEMGGAGMRVGATLSLRGPDGKSVTVTPETSVQGAGAMQPHPIKAPGTPITLTLTGIAVPQIQLTVSGLSGGSGGAAGEAVVELSIKPLINLLWLGTVLILAGGVVAGIRRAREAGQSKA